MAVAKRRLDGRQLAVGRSDALDGGDFCALCLDGEHQARSHGCPVDEHRAGPAHAVLAPEMRAGEVAPFPEEVGKGQARLDGCAPLLPVHATVTSSSCIASLLARGPPSPAPPSPLRPGFGTRTSRVDPMEWNPASTPPGPDARRLDVRQRLSDDLVFGRAGPLRRGSHADQTDGAASDPVVAVDLQGDGGARNGEVAVAAGDLLDGETATAAPEREAISR